MVRSWLCDICVYVCVCIRVFGSDGVKKQKHKQKNPQLVCSVSRWWHHSFIMCLALGKPAENKVPRDLQTYLSVLWFKWNRHTHTHLPKLPQTHTSVTDVMKHHCLWRHGHSRTHVFTAVPAYTGTGNNKTRSLISDTTEEIFLILPFPYLYYFAASSLYEMNVYEKKGDPEQRCLLLSCHQRGGVCNVLLSGNLTVLWRCF